MQYKWKHAYMVLVRDCSKIITGGCMWWWMILRGVEMANTWKVALIFYQNVEKHTLLNIIKCHNKRKTLK